MSATLCAHALSPCTQAMDDASMKKSEIDEIVLVGGSTRIPKVRAPLPNWVMARHSGWQRALCKLDLPVSLECVRPLVAALDG